MIHAVGPIYRGGIKGEAELLESAYLESLRLAAEKGLESLSFPAISAGVYGYPQDEAAFIALKTALDFLKEKSSVKLVCFVLFGRPMYDIFAAQLKRLHPE